MIATQKTIERPEQESRALAIVSDFCATVNEQLIFKELNLSFKASLLARRPTWYGSSSRKWGNIYLQAQSAQKSKDLVMFPVIILLSEEVTLYQTNPPRQRTHAYMGSFTPFDGVDEYAKFIKCIAGHISNFCDSVPKLDNKARAIIKEALNTVQSVQASKRKEDIVIQTALSNFERLFPKLSLEEILESKVLPVVAARKSPTLALDALKS